MTHRNHFKPGMDLLEDRCTPATASLFVNAGILDQLSVSAVIQLSMLPAKPVEAAAAVREFHSDSHAAVRIDRDSISTTLETSPLREIQRIAAPVVENLVSLPPARAIESALSNGRGVIENVSDAAGIGDVPSTVVDGLFPPIDNNPSNPGAPPTSGTELRGEPLIPTNGLIGDTFGILPPAVTQPIIQPEPEAVPIPIASTLRGLELNLRSEPALPAIITGESTTEPENPAIVDEQSEVAAIVQSPSVSNRMWAWIILGAGAFAALGELVRRYWYARTEHRTPKLQVRTSGAKQI